MPRREFNADTKRKALKRAAGQCEGLLDTGERCPASLQIGRYHFDHVVPVVISDDASLSNAQVLCVVCHARKTVTDQRVIAKVKRVADRHAGTTAPRQKIQSAGFRKPAPPRRATQPLSKPLPERARPLIVSGEV